MTTTPDPGPPASAGRRRGGRGRLHRRLAGALVLGLGLLTTAGLYTAITQDVNVAHAQEADAALLQRGQELFNENACITCHGSNLQGVEGRGPSLIGVGDAAVYFQVSSGRMPLARQEAQAERKPTLPLFDPETEEGQANLDALGAYIQASGGGPTRPEAQGEALRGEDSARARLDAVGRVVGEDGGHVYVAGRGLRALLGRELLRAQDGRLHGEDVRDDVGHAHQNLLLLG